MASLLTQIKVRQDTYENIKDLVLTQGEPGFAHDTGDYAVGNGTNKFSDICFKLQKGVINNGTSTDNAIARFDGTTGRVVQNSEVLIQDNGSLKTVENKMGLQVRTHASYEGGWVYGTAGNEALTLALQNPVTAFQIVYGTKPSAFGTSTWQTVTPLFQTKDGKVIINRQIDATADTTNLKLLDVNGTLGVSGQITSTVATDTAPFAVTSTTVNTNLNADLLDGKHASEFQPAGNYVTGPSSATDSAIALYDGTTGKIIKNSGATIDANRNLKFNGPGNISWEDGSYYQRIQITDDSNQNTAVFTFQQTENSGTTWNNLFTIQDRGTIVAKNPDGGALSLTLDRGSNANWRWLSDNGNFIAQCDYTTAKGSYFNVLTLAYNTGNVSVDKGSLTSKGGFIHGNLTVPNGSTKDDYVLLAGGGTKAVGDFAMDTDLINLTYYVKGTQTASTNAWTGSLTQVSALYEGLTIRYRLPYAGTSSGATLNLTLSDGTTTGAKKIYRYGTTTQITTHFAAGSVITMTYDGTNWIVDAFYDSDAKIRQYQHGENETGATNKYPLLVRYNLTNKNNSYDTSYARFHTEAYVDISDGSLTAKGFKYNDATTGTNSYVLLAGGGTKALSDFTDTTYGADRGISLVNGNFGHDNTAVTAVTTAGLYKIKYDAYGHITGTESFSLPTVNNGKLTMAVSGTGLSLGSTKTFTANQSSNATITYTLDSNAEGNRTANQVVIAKADGRINSEQLSITNSGAEKVTMQYDTSYRALKFVFA